MTSETVTVPAEPDDALVEAIASMLIYERWDEGLPDKEMLLTFACEKESYRAAYRDNAKAILRVVLAARPSPAVQPTDGDRETIGWPDEARESWRAINRLRIAAENELARLQKDHAATLSSERERARAEERERCAKVALDREQSFIADKRGASSDELRLLDDLSRLCGEIAWSIRSLREASNPSGGEEKG